MKRTVIVIVAIAIAGALNIAYPFKGDQALFAIGAKMLANGAVLYRDFWDLKQPGIYWFYHAAAALFGYDETGIHIAELLWFVALAFVISISTRRRFVLPWMSDVCALLTVGVYFAVCGTWHLTQLEGLVSLPLFLCLLLVIPVNPTQRVSAPRWLAFGILIAVVALFKLMLIAIPVTFLFVSISPGAKLFFRNCLLTAAGAAMVIVPVLFYFSAQHQLPLMYKTFFIYPPRIVHEVPMNGIKVLLHGSRWFVISAGPLLPLALVGLVCRLRKPFDQFTLAIIAWLVVAAILVLIQRMWWEYHFLLPLFPLGILATMGLEDAILWMRARTFPAALTTALVVLVLCPFALRSIHKAIDQARHRNFRSHISPDYANAAVEAEWLTTASTPTTEIYVLGDPLINFLSGQTQRVAINGWSPEFLLPEQWTELANDITAEQPKFIFIAADDKVVIDDRGNPIKQLIAEKYLPAHVDSIGIWYSRIMPVSSVDH